MRSNNNGIRKVVDYLCDKYNIEITDEDEKYMEDVLFGVNIPIGSFDCTTDSIPTYPGRDEEVITTTINPVAGDVYPFIHDHVNVHWVNPNVSNGDLYAEFMRQYNAGIVPISHTPIAVTSTSILNQDISYNEQGGQNN